MAQSEDQTAVRSVYLSGNFAPVDDEVTALDLPVEGELPPELCGRYLRNGPNPAEPVDPATHHWFLGDGMVHGIRLNEGRAEWYRNRYVGSSHISGLRGEPDIAGPNWNGVEIGPNTSVGGFAGTTWALMEAGACPVELTYELGTVGRNDFSGTITGAFSAHPKYDPATGELHAIAYALPDWMDHIAYVVIGPDGMARQELEIPIAGMPMIHDMALTSSYALVLDQPVTVDIERAAESAFPFRWNPDHGARVGLLPRDGASSSGGDLEIVWIDIPLGYVFHTLNAYDTADGNVIVDVCNYDRMFDQDILGPFGDGAFGRLERWELNPSTRRASITVVDERPNEFPRCNDAVATSEHRYGWFAALTAAEGEGWKTVKHDLVTGDRWSFDHGPGRAAGEAVFVARSGARGSHNAAEDDGWLMTIVADRNTGASEFVVMDAADFSRTDYVARVRLPQRVPFGFHGNWVGDSSVPPASR